MLILKISYLTGNTECVLSRLPNEILVKIEDAIYKNYKMN